MKTRTPLDRYDLKIKKKDYVLEIGPGHNPHPRSNVLVEKYEFDNTHRCGDVKKRDGQKLIIAPGESLPFGEKEFDYVICNQVLEHVDDPQIFLKEMCRVAKHGYLETPSLIGEFLFPKGSHKWLIMELNNKLYVYPKNSNDFHFNFGELFLNYLPYQSLLFKLLWLTDGNLFLNRIEWEDSIEVEELNDETLQYFIQAWNRKMTETYCKPRLISTELKNTIVALFHLIKSFVKNKLNLL